MWENGPSGNKLADLIKKNIPEESCQQEGFNMECTWWIPAAEGFVKEGWDDVGDDGILAKENEGSNLEMPMEAQLKMLYYAAEERLSDSERIPEDVRKATIVQAWNYNNIEKATRYIEWIISKWEK